MKRSPPANVIVLATVNIVVGLVGVAVGLLGLSFFSSLQGEGRFAGLIAAVNRAVPGWLHIEIGKAALVAVLGAGLIVASACLFALQNWARWYCLVYGVLAILLHLGYLVFNTAG
jgi:hypothetical protein